MDQQLQFRLSIQESLESQEVESREGIVEAALRATPERMAAALQASAGFADVGERIPGLIDWPNWEEIAFFSVCRKSGSALWLDLFDSDQFDGFTDMRRCVGDCRAWFSDRGYATWGSAETRTGRINCYFNAPSNGNYLCTAALQGYPSGASASVECLIDNASFGPLPFSGTIYQPHPCSLSAGGHHFRIRQQSGAFFFLSLDVQRV
jgi:hypothetical protein